ncbi:MAG TPA: TIGR03943 family protein [Pseudonocardiaceae bacterium]
MRRETTNVLLVLVGGALVKITLNGTYLRYVRPTALPWVLAAGMITAGLGVVAIVRDVLADRGRQDHCHAGRWVWLLVLPVLAIVLVAPPALGADSVVRAGNRTATVARPTALPPLPRGAVVPIAMSEFIARSVWDATGSLTGRTVQLTGFVVHDNGTDYLARLVITCCAADATPMKVALAGRQAGHLPDNQWVRMAGVPRPGSATEANGYTATIVVSSLITIDAPADPYEY